MSYYDGDGPEDNGMGCLISTLVVFVIAAVILLAVSTQTTEPTEENIEMLRNGPDGAYGNDPYLTKVGDTLQLKFVKHIENQEYEIAWENSRGELVWDNTDRDIEGYIRVVHEEDLEESYLKRERNNLDIDKEGIMGMFRYVSMSSNSYTLHIAGDDLEGGTTTRQDCGKNCTRDVQTEIIGK